MDTGQVGDIVGIGDIARDLKTSLYARSITAHVRVLPADLLTRSYKWDGDSIRVLNAFDRTKMQPDDLPISPIAH